MDIKVFKWWLNKGVYRIGHLFSCTDLLPLKHFEKELEIPSTEKFKFHQISCFIHSIWKNKPNPLGFTGYERWCGQAIEQRGGISIIYESLATNYPT